MSILANYKIIYARFTNPQHDTIEVLYEDEGVSRPYYVPALDNKHDDVKYLAANGWDFEAILGATGDYQQGEKKALLRIYKSLAAEEVNRLETEMKEKIEKLKQQELEKSSIITAIVSNNDDDEAVFRAKLAVFELPKVKASKDKKLKGAIRKANTLLELISLTSKYI